MLALVDDGGKGQAITITARAPGARNADTGVRTVTPTAHIGSGIERSYTAREIDGTVIQRGDKKFMLSPLKSDGTVMPIPTTKDQATLGGKSWTIESVDARTPAGEFIYAYLQLRGI